MPQHWLNFLTLTIWDSRRNAGSWFDIAYPAFNLFEACCWFGLAIYVLRRALKHDRRPLEFAYASLWFIFGLTDVREAYAQQVVLILFKGVVLVGLLVVRRRVIRGHSGYGAF